MRITAIVLLLVIVPTSGAWAAQMDVFIAEDDSVIKPEYKFLRIIFIDYPNGGIIAENLVGKQETISFTVDATQLQPLISEINADFEKRSSSSTVTDVKVDYRATITGRENQAVIEYRINMLPTIKGFEVRESKVDVTRVIDSTWRGFDVDVPVVVDTEQYGSFDINSPGSALHVFSADTHDIIQKEKKDSVINDNIFDASGIYELPLSKWHFLFDPTAIIEESKNMGFSGDVVVSHYSMGECNIEVGPCSDRKLTEYITADKDYTIRAVESQDDATISIEGFTVKDNILGLEVFGISAESTNTGNPGTDEFPATVIYGMAVVAAVGGIVFFFVSDRKLKGEKNQGQRGIDPALLSSYPTSESSGGYHTNRGEAQIRKYVEKKTPL